MQIVITGASGFVGSALLEKLTKSEHDPIIVTRNTSQLKSSDKKIIVENIDSTTNWGNSLKTADVIIHCAARVHVMKESALDPLQAFKAVNTEGTIHFARQAAASGVKRFIFVSSIKVNGEETLPGRKFTPYDEHIPSDPYALSKYQAEQGLRDIQKETGMEVVIIRPPLIYGPGVKANFAALMKLSSSGIPLPFASIKRNRRSLVFIDNLVDLLICCIHHPKAANQTFLVSDDEDLSTSQMIEYLAQANGKKSRQFPFSVKALELLGKITGKGAIVNRLCGSLQLDISETKNLLDWTPPFSTQTSFEKTVKHYFRNTLSGNIND